MSENRNLFANGEGDKYFDRNVSRLNKRKENKNDTEISILINWLRPFKNNINSICEIGCSGGHRLYHLANELEAEGFGIDPSESAVESIKEMFPKLHAKVGFGDKIPFSEKFDLVHLGFFMYLVDREFYFRSISEADRLVKFGGFLSILDFDVPIPYSNKYKHKEGGYSHKINNSNVFVASGLYTVVNKFTYDISDTSNLQFTSDIDNRVSMTLLYKEKDVFSGSHD